MTELLAHLVGDYCLQNHWMAMNKTSAWLPAIVHAFFYTLPFLFLSSDPRVLAIIFGTHLLIDRFRLAGYWVRFWGVGTAGTVPTFVEVILRAPRDVLAVGTPLYEHVRSGEGEHPRVVLSCLPADAPPWLGVWLTILVDNTMHLAINHFALNH